MAAAASNLHRSVKSLSYFRWQSAHNNHAVTEKKEEMWNYDSRELSMTVLSDGRTLLLSLAAKKERHSEKGEIPLFANSTANRVMQGQQLAEIRSTEMRKTKIFGPTTAADRQ
jgi:hypothetical protein